MTDRLYPNLLITDRPGGSIIVRNKDGRMVMVARKTQVDWEAWMYMHPSMTEPKWLTGSGLKAFLEGVNLSEGEDRGGAPVLNVKFITFMTGSR